MSAPLIGHVTAPDLHVMSFNIRRRVDGLTWPPSDRWSVRRSRLSALLEEEHPTVLGTQEVLPDQAATVLDALGPSYRAVGHGRRPGGRGEGCPMFYDAERLEILAWRQEALSDRPDVAGSTSWGALFPRVLVHAAFRDRQTSVDFVVMNTHLDVFSARARLRAAERIHHLVEAETRPVLVLSDFNAGPGSPPLTALQGGGRLRDAWDVAESRDAVAWATYGGYREPRPGRRIDGILVSSDVQVRKVTANRRTYDGGWPSDHLPVQTVVRIPKRKDAE